MRPVSFVSGTTERQDSDQPCVPHRHRLYFHRPVLAPFDSIRSDPYLSTSRRADKARSIADFCCSSRATMPWSPPANSDRFQGDALTLVF